MPIGKATSMLTLLILLFVIVLLAGMFAGPRYYRGRRTIIERDDML